MFVGEVGGGGRVAHVDGHVRWAGVIDNVAAAVCCGGGGRGAGCRNARWVKKVKKVKKIKKIEKVKK